MSASGTDEDSYREDRFDLIVLGSGAAGLTAALTARFYGLSPVVLESQPVIGGTSARSSGTVWVPDSSFLRREGVTDDREKVERYLAGLVGNKGPDGPWRRFLDAAPAMLDEMIAKARLTFKPFMAAPDYRQDVPGAAPGGRPLEPQAFDGHLLGEDFERLARPLPELMVFGGMMVTRSEAAKLLKADRDLGGMSLGVRLMLRYLRDRLKHARGTRLVLGNALVGALLKTCRDNAIPVWTSVQVDRLTLDANRVAGVDGKHNGRTLALVAEKGVVLAGGGFPASARMREEHLPSPTPPDTPAAPGCVGSTIELARTAGAALGPSGLDNGLWFPSSIFRRGDGTDAVYPHIILDRPKPGLIAVNGAGKRFTNEAISYHEFVRAMYAETEKGGDAVPAWLIVDRSFIAKYGLGVIRPRTPSLRKYVRSGYLLEAETVRLLAILAGLPPDDLEATVVRFNAFAADGTDPDFHKGETIYDRANGDPEVGPNPCLGPITHGPFYALKVWPTPLGTSRGLLTDGHSRVLNENGEPIAGLYGCGNDVQSAFAGEYPGAGAQLGQAMTFGWLAGRHAANHPFSPAGIKSPEETEQPLRHPA
ncbi:FAD-dependent oxidoreductase [Roseibium aggregatum]|uniref:FAD-binding protein n=1 Tax=Roseibium aggregatum TaxID=187304 RepID=A0A939J4T8_9HYPH|nr:FAD-dependent oxidoreductase [Roseibium aggregatum]MBN9671520.1 FAD-binding protein [Roseibium aggregatum]